nr:Chain C, HAUS augmin-like complex subunit 3 [Homo sapiens]6PTE_D Chain D, HAUS augmin-like complex subunit 3 [Homo sapiens]6PTE_G Chain G, HAUS augmin-like complex subunit 3 [Homo sapiens]6PTE_J Chain J, HAUS augmin-like complex subunit 3 [Homo sapiens]
ILNAMITKI